MFIRVQRESSNKSIEIKTSKITSLEYLSRRKYVNGFPVPQYRLKVENIEESLYVDADKIQRLLDLNKSHYSKIL